MKLEFELPSGLDRAAYDAAARAAREAAALELFAAHALSAGRAAELMGVPLRDFLRLASQRGLPVIDLPPEGLDNDVQNALGARPRPS